MHLLVFNTVLQASSYCTINCKLYVSWQCNIMYTLHRDNGVVVGTVSILAYNYEQITWRKFFLVVPKSLRESVTFAHVLFLYHQYKCLLYVAK